jgi:hypothetical protein
MPIKFACPACKNVMTVDNKFAGKTGKCTKCGGAVTVPNSAPTGTGSQTGASGKAGATSTTASASTPTAADARAQQIAALNSAPPPSAGKLTAAGPLGHVFDELTESDYSRQSPYQNVYSPPKPKAVDNAALRKAASTAGGGDDKAPKIRADGKARTPGTLIFISVVDIIVAIGLYVLAVAFAVEGIGFLDPVKDKLPNLPAEMSVLIIISGFLATMIMAAGLGILMKQVWGYAVAVFVNSFTVGFLMLVLLKTLSEPIRLIVPGPCLLIFIVFTAYFFHRDCKAAFGVKSSKLALIVAGIGLATSLSIGGLLFLLGAFASLPSTVSET